MTKTSSQAAALVLAAVTTLGVFAGMNGLATQQYAAADRMASAQAGTQVLALQRVVVIGHRA